MTADLDDLVAILEEEIAVGEELRHNLACQRQALVDWNMEALIAGIEIREVRLRSLGDLERRRLKILTQDGSADSPIKLKQLISQSSEGLPARVRLQSLRTRALETFSRLQADERSVNGLMEDLITHLRDALTPLTRSSVSLYGERGATAPQRPATIFIRNKA
jgi:hypothetical protein